MINPKFDEIYIRKLNPENCEEKGYTWEGDTIYDEEAPEEARAEFPPLFKQGWKLGEPANRSFEQNGGYGLYRPMDKEQDDLTNTGS
ncbi:MAG: hypothetical protein RI947_525 [Candidatus Parcubacteria bacterium]|jgi:hypothetical protein